MIHNLGYCYSNSLHYYEDEEGADDNDPNRRNKNSDIAQEVMANHAQYMAIDSKEDKSNV